MELLDRCRLWHGLILGGMTFGVPEGGGGGEMLPPAVLLHKET
jgi:hypothetical protein